uniref:Uncharacterized protein n=1 Tax=Anguilla anguilla TaxID=7936 RepID=A0A0E9SMH9_ANGAN
MRSWCGLRMNASVWHNRTLDFAQRGVE